MEDQNVETEMSNVDEHHPRTDTIAIVGIVLIVFMTVIIFSLNSKK